MNKAFLLGGLFLRVTAVYASATHGDLIAEGRRRNEEVYEHSLEEARWKTPEQVRQQKTNASQDRQKTSQSSKPKSS